MMDIFHSLAFSLRKSRTTISFRHFFLYQKQDGFDVIFWPVTPCNVAERYRRLGGTCWYMSQVAADRRRDIPEDVNVYAFCREKPGISPAQTLESWVRIQLGARMS
jgi:hypothetical protein